MVGTPKTVANAKKQGTLFSFFSKKSVSSSSPSSLNGKTDSKPPNTVASSISSDATSSSEGATAEETRIGSTEKSNLSKVDDIASRISPTQEKLLDMIKLGTAISVYWPDDDEYYNAKVTAMKRCVSGKSNVVTLL